MQQNGAAPGLPRGVSAGCGGARAARGGPRGAPPAGTGGMGWARGARGGSRPRRGLFFFVLSAAFVLTWKPTPLSVPENWKLKLPKKSKEN